MSRIVLVRDKMPLDELASFLGEPFEDMVKYVVDVERGVIAVGGELHVDGEALLLADGSDQRHLWGANLYPRRPAGERIEYTSLINIRPSQGNPSMEVLDPGLRDRIRRLTEDLLLGREEGLA